MKNIPLSGWFIACYLLFGQNFFVSHARSMHVHLSSEIVAECLNQTNVTSEELVRLRDMPEKRIKLINGGQYFRRYGCFLACVMRHRGTMTGSTLNADAIAEHVDKRLDSNLDVKLFLHKTIETCANTFRGIDDECKASACLQSVHIEIHG